MIGCRKILLDFCTFREIDLLGVGWLVITWPYRKKVKMMISQKQKIVIVMLQNG